MNRAALDEAIAQALSRALLAELRAEMMGVQTKAPTVPPVEAQSTVRDEEDAHLHEHTDTRLPRAS